MEEPIQGSNIGQEPESLKESGTQGWMKNFLITILLILIVMGSFWISFQLGKKILVVKKAPSKIEVTIPEPPPSIKALQKLEEAMSASVETSTSAPRASVDELAGKPAEVKKMEIRPMLVRKKAGGAGKCYYKVQAGWFADKSNAEKLANQLKAKGFDIYVKKVRDGWRVQVGAFRSKTEAKVLQSTLGEKGFNSQIIYE